jgi:hypothetical protein
MAKQEHDGVVKKKRPLHRTRQASEFAFAMYGIRLYAIGTKAQYAARWGAIRHDVDYVVDSTAKYGKKAAAYGNANRGVALTGVGVATAAGVGYGYYKYRQHQGSSKITYSKKTPSGKTIKVTRKRGRNQMAKGRGSWSGGRAPAQGSTPQRISKPETPKGKLKGKMKKGVKGSRKGGL